MSEKFKPESISPEQAEEAKFWDEEIAEHLKTASPDVKKGSRDQIIDSVMNNLKQKFRMRGKLDAESMRPEQFEAAKRLEADMDLYITENSLEDEYQRIATELARRTKLLEEGTRKMDIAMLKSITWEIPETEVREFYKKAYRALRGKGYTRDQIAA